MDRPVDDLAADDLDQADGAGAVAAIGGGLEVDRDEVQPRPRF